MMPRQAIEGIAVIFGVVEELDVELILTFAAEIWQRFDDVRLKV